MDVCCLNRPFDDQSQERIKLESEAVLIILNFCQNGKWRLLNSEVIDFEILSIVDIYRQSKIITILSISDLNSKVKIDRKTVIRAKEITKIGFKPFDAMHIACAKSANADIFLTTDDKLLKNAHKNIKMLNVKIDNPVLWLMETKTK
ncbi:MAG: PIN domain-containing protein [bacterium]